MIATPTKNVIGMIETGFFKGRKVVVPDDPKERWVLVERTRDHFSLACLYHDKFIGNNGCDQCASRD